MEKSSNQTIIQKTVKSGVTFGSALAMVISYTAWKSIGWAIVHGLLSWAYVKSRYAQPFFLRKGNGEKYRSAWADRYCFVYSRSYTCCRFCISKAMAISAGLGRLWGLYQQVGMPAMRPPFMSLVRESPTISMSSFGMSGRAAKTFSKKAGLGFSAPSCSERKIPFIQRPRPERSSFFVWATIHPPMEGLDDVQTVVPIDHRVPQGVLIPGVEGFGQGRVHAHLRKELPIPADQHLLLGDLAPFEALPVAFVDGGIPGHHLIRAFPQPEFPEQPLDGRLLCR